jgi:hypothetical protein
MGIFNFRLVFYGQISYRMAIAILALPLMISGCASVRGFPERLIEPGVALKEIAPIVTRKNIEACNAVKTIDCRNHILSAGMIGIDINFSEFERKLFKENREISFLTTVTTLGLTTAGAMTGTAALSGIATGIIGSKEAFDKEILLDQAKNAIHTQMRALRQTVANRIRFGMMRPSFEEYPLDAALIDIEEYYNAGTLLGAFVGITASAGQQVAESEVNKALIAKGEEPKIFSPLVNFNGVTLSPSLETTDKQWLDEFFLKSKTNKNDILRCWKEVGTRQPHAFEAASDLFEDPFAVDIPKVRRCLEK